MNCKVLSLDEIMEIEKGRKVVWLLVPEFYYELKKNFAQLVIDNITNHKTKYCYVYPGTRTGRIACNNFVEILIQNHISESHPISFYETTRRYHDMVPINLALYEPQSKTKCIAILMGRGIGLDDMGIKFTDNIAENIRDYIQSVAKIMCKQIKLSDIIIKGSI